MLSSYVSSLSTFCVLQLVLGITADATGSQISDIKNPTFQDAKYSTPILILKENSNNTIATFNYQERKANI